MNYLVVSADLFTFLAGVIRAAPDLLDPWTLARDRQDLRTVGFIEPECKHRRIIAESEIIPIPYQRYHTVRRSDDPIENAEAMPVPTVTVKWTRPIRADTGGANYPPSCERNALACPSHASAASTTLITRSTVYHEQMPDLENKQKYMIKRDLAVEVANLAEIESYDPDREASFPADFRKEETKQLYEKITGESGEDLSQREMNTVMMQEIGGGIKAAYQYDLTREDLKVIHRELSQRDDQDSC